MCQCLQWVADQCRRSISGVGEYLIAHRPSHVIPLNTKSDLLRAVVTVETGRELVDMLGVLHSRFGFVKVVNEMALPKEAVWPTFQVRSCKAYIQYGHPDLKTVGHLCRNAVVQRQWSEYKKNPPPPDVPRGRWDRQIDLALTWLRDPEISQRPVQVVAELECTVRTHAEVRREMAELLRIHSAESCAHLYRDYADQVTPINTADGRESKMSPLLFASEQQDTQSIRELLDAGQPTDLVLEALVIAAGHGAAEAVQMLLKHAAATIVPTDHAKGVGGGESTDDDDELSEESTVPTQYDTALDRSLIAAAAAGHLQATRMLLESKVSVMAIDSKGRTALHTAAAADHFDVAELLIAAKAGVHAVSGSHDGCRTPLHCAAQAGHVLLSSMLLSCKADISKATSNGDTAISLAARYRHLDILRLCMSAKADINTSNNQRETALFLAVSANAFSIAQALVESKADVGTGAGGWTPLMVAEDFKRADIVQLLKEWGAV